MFALAVFLAVAAALVIAFGAELQEHAAVQVWPRHRWPLGFLSSLLHDARWVVGVVLALIGVVMHAVALTKGPVVAIQPVGSVGLLFAVGIKAAVDRTRLEPLAAVGCAAVIAGLAVLLILLPHGAGTTTVSVPDAILASGCAVAVTGLALLLPAKSVRIELRAGAVALGAGMCFGIGAALVAVVGRRIEQDVTNVLSWPALLVVVLLICGGIAQQVAYRMARFAVVYAVILTVDPLTAGFAGVLLLGEPMPSTSVELTGLALAALVAVAGIVVLAHARAANYTSPREAQPCAS